MAFHLLFTPLYFYVQLNPINCGALTAVCIHSNSTVALYLLLVSTQLWRTHCCWYPLNCGALPAVGIHSTVVLYLLLVSTKLLCSTFCWCTINCGALLLLLSAQLWRSTCCWYPLNCGALPAVGVQLTLALYLLLVSTELWRKSSHRCLEVARNNVIVSKCKSFLSAR